GRTDRAGTGPRRLCRLARAPGRLGGRGARGGAGATAPVGQWLLVRRRRLSEHLYTFEVHAQQGVADLAQEAGILRMGTGRGAQPFLDTAQFAGLSQRGEIAQDGVGQVASRRPWRGGAASCFRVGAAPVRRPAVDDVDRNLELEPAALAWTALHGQAATHFFDEIAGDVQAQPYAARGGPELVVWLEDRRLRLGGDTYARIAYRELERATLARDAGFDTQ